MLLLKLAFALGALFQFKLYSDSKVSQAKIVAGILVGVYFLRSAMSALFEGRPQGLIVTLLTTLTFILLIANLVVALTAKNPSAPPQARQ
jgi:F0F1-type ATP synthase assembly protein I